MIRIPGYVFCRSEHARKVWGDQKTQRKKGIHSKQEIEPGNTTMTGPEPNEQQVTFPINSDGYLPGGIETSRTDRGGRREARG